MPQYTPPLRDMQFVLHEVLKVEDAFKELPPHADLDAETVDSIVEEAGKFASNVIFPLNQSGDEEGCTYVGDGVVTAPKGFKQAYAQYCEQIGRAHVGTPVTNAHLVCRLLLEQKKQHIPSSKAHLS